MVVGDNVLYGKYDGSQVEYNGRVHQLIRDDDVLLTYDGEDVTLETAIPTKDNILVELPIKENATVAGLVVSASSNENIISASADYGKVIKVGSGRQAGSACRMDIQVKPGDQIQFRRYAGEQIKIEGTSYLVLKCYDVLAKVKL